MDGKNGIENLLEKLSKESPIRRRKNVSFVRIVKSNFEKLESLREQGYSFDLIFEKLSLGGFLEERQDPKHLQQAFQREKLRREKVKHKGVDKKIYDTEKKTASSKDLLQSKPPEVSNSTSPDSAIPRIRKKSDGTFEFD